MIDTTAVNASKKKLIKEFYDYSKAAVSSSIEKDIMKLAGLSNLAHNQLLSSKLSQINSLPVLKREEQLLQVHYCYIISMLQARHEIWKYDYMAFSRRMGEIWESFCASSWSIPNCEAEIIKSPDSNLIKTKIYNSYDSLEMSDKDKETVLEITDTLFALLGRINLKLDMLSKKSGILVGIDFKSGFGSNEKGNTERLLIVGKTYKFLYPNCELYLLVRQNINNNYLERLRNSGTWQVLCGQEAYLKIEEITGVEINKFVTQCVDFEADLSTEVYSDLKANIPSFSKYIKWV